MDLHVFVNEVDKNSSFITETERTREYIRTKLLNAKEAGLQEVDLISRNIHKEMGFTNRFTIVCAAMKSLGLYRMEVIQSPPKGRGAKLRIRYYLVEAGEGAEDK